MKNLEKVESRKVPEADTNATTHDEKKKKASKPKKPGFPSFYLGIGNIRIISNSSNRSAKAE